MVVVLCMLIAFLLARSGLVAVPIFSSFFQNPGPSERVENIPASAASALPTLLSSFKKESEGMVSVALPEEALTAAAREAAESMRSQGIHAEAVQVASLADGTIELYVPFTSPAGPETSFTLRLKPRVEAGTARIALVKARVGQLSLPAALLGKVVEKQVNGVLDTWMKQGEAYFTLTGLDVIPEGVKLIGTPTVRGLLLLHS